MSRTYELWDTTTRNLIGAYAREAEALCLVRQHVSQDPLVEVAAWIRLWNDDTADEGGEVAAGTALAALAAADDHRQGRRPNPTARPRAG